METKKRKVGEARESCANLLDFHDVVDDWGEKNPCTDSSYLHVSPTNAISTASNVSTAAPPLACTTPLTSPVASTSREKFCFVSLSSLRPNFPSVLLFTVWITYMASIPHKPVCNCKRELYPYSGTSLKYRGSWNSCSFSKPVRTGTDVSSSLMYLVSISFRLRLFCN